MTKHSYITIGYLQSKLIRTPLHYHQEWNKRVNDADYNTLINMDCEQALGSGKLLLAFANLTYVNNNN